MIYYLILAYYIQCFRAYRFQHKTGVYTRLEGMCSFDDTMKRIVRGEGDRWYRTLENIWEYTSFNEN